jgi:5,10-methylenetetrahydrofolate reductase
MVREIDSGCRFEVICEVEPPTRPDLTRVRHQIGVLSHVADSFLIPDNHIGRATVSSVAVAHEVQAMGARGIACLNSRDRNLLGFRRDLLTAAAYGVDSFLYVYGDKPSAGGRTGELTVQAMIEETRAVAGDPMFSGLAPFRAGVTCGLRAIPPWKARADFVFTQVSYSLESQLRWRESVQVPGPVYAGVMVLASAAMARNLAGTIPDIDIPADLVTAVERDRNAGVEAACQQVLAIRESGAFDGVHLVSVGRYRQVAAMLETELHPRVRVTASGTEPQAERLDVLPHRDVDGEAGPVIMGDLDGSEVSPAPGCAQAGPGGRAGLMPVSPLDSRCLEPGALGGHDRLPQFGL